MPLTEQEEFELLSLERQRHVSNLSSGKQSQPGTLKELGLGLSEGFGTLGIGILQRLGQASEQDVESVRRAYEPQTTARNVGQFVGQAGIPVAASTLIPGAASAAGAFTSGAGIGAAQGAITPTAPGESVAMNAGIGGLLGGTGNVFGYGLGKALTPPNNSLRQPMVDQARQQGLKVLPSQATGNATLRAVEDAFRAIPTTSRQMHLIDEANQSLINSRFAAAIGQPGKKLTEDTVSETLESLGKEMDNLAKGQWILTGRPSFTATIDDAIARYKALDPSLQSKEILSKLESFRQWGKPGQIVPGEVWQTNRSIITKELNNAARSSAPDAAQTSMALGGIKDALDIVQPQTKEWAEVNTKYAILSNLIKKDVLDGSGNVNVAKYNDVLQAVNKRTYAKGELPMQDLVRPADELKLTQGLVGSPTAQRALALNMLAGGSLGGGYGYMSGKDPLASAAIGMGAGLAVPYAAQRLYLNPAGQSLMTRGLFGGQMTVPQGINPGLLGSFYLNQ